MRQPARDSGFTLIEVMVTVVLIGAFLAFTVAGWSQWARARAQSETASELRSVLRSTQQRAISEGTTMCVSFTSTSYTVWRSSCTSGTRVDGPVQAEGDAVISGPTFVPPTSATAVDTVSFTPRGTASSGHVTITRPGSSTTYEVRLQGITGRAYLCHNGSCDAS